MLHSVRSGYAPVVPWTAVGLLLVGTALVRSRLPWTWVLGAGAAVMGAVHLADAVLDARLWPVDALFRDAVTEVDPARPGQMSPLTAADFAQGYLLHRAAGSSDIAAMASRSAAEPAG